MNIKFAPQDKNHPRDKKVNTNIGEFLLGESRTLTEQQEKEGRRLIENGDFVEVSDAPEPPKAEEGAPSPPEPDPLDELITARKKRVQ